MKVPFCNKSLGFLEIASDLVMLFLRFFICYLEGGEEISFNFCFAGFGTVDSITEIFKVPLVVNFSLG